MTEHRGTAFRWPASLMAVVILACGGPGCGPGDAGPHATTPLPRGTRVVLSNGGTYIIKLEFSPEPVPFNRPFDIKFTVEQNPKGNFKPSDPTYSVDVDARMPAHFHGMNRVPKVSRRPDGSFIAEGLLLHMPGHWELYLDISQGGRSERAQLDIDLK